VCTTKPHHLLILIIEKIRKNSKHVCIYFALCFALLAQQSTNKTNKLNFCNGTNLESIWRFLVGLREYLLYYHKCLFRGSSNYNMGEIETLVPSRVGFFGIDVKDW